MSVSFAGSVCFCSLTGQLELSCALAMTSVDLLMAVPGMLEDHMLSSRFWESYIEPFPRRNSRATAFAPFCQRYASNGPEIGVQAP